MTEPESSRQWLTDQLDNRTAWTVTGRELAAVLQAWGFVKVLPEDDWTAGPSYWRHPEHPHLQLPLAAPGPVHPAIGEAVLSMVNSVLAVARRR